MSYATEKTLARLSIALRERDVEADMAAQIAALMDGGITVIAPDGSRVEHIPMPDPYTTNICFGGADLKTAYITQSPAGKLIACEWPTPGLPLNFLNT